MKKVLYWADFDFKLNYSKRLIKQLKEHCPEYDFTYLKEIWKIGDESFDLNEYDVIILQSTDVTKFSADDSEITRIGEKLEDYIDEGKKIIVSHDVIYRRTRNERLQDMYNYKIKNFARAKEVEYFKTTFCKKTNAFSSLNDSFKLWDGEVCWGDVTNLNDKMVFFETEVKDPTNDQAKIFVPTVFGKKYNGGSLIWFNTGDTFEDPPKAIAELDKNFVNLLIECLNINIYNLTIPEKNGDEILRQLKVCDLTKPFVFISYCESNAARVYEICLMLDYLGVNYFIDKKNIVSSSFYSEGWKTEITNALNNENCTSAFIFLSEEYFASSNCLYEIEQISLHKKFIPVLLSISLSINKIPKIIDRWQAVSDYLKITLYRDLLSIKKKPDSNEVEVNQLVFNCHRNLSQFHDHQLLNTLKANCKIDDARLFDENYINSLIAKCKQITEKV